MPGGSDDPGPAEARADLDELTVCFDRAWDRIGTLEPKPTTTS